MRLSFNSCSLELKGDGNANVASGIKCKCVFRFNSELKKVADHSLAKTLAAPLDIVRHMRQVGY